MTAISLLWLIPVLPALGALLNGLFGWRFEHGRRGVITAVALASTALSMLLALWNIVTLATLDWAHLPALPANVTADAAHHSLSLHLATWIPVGNFLTGLGHTGHFNVDWLFVLDPLASIMLFVVTVVGFLIHVYSVGYMAHDTGYFRYFTYLNLFMAMMLTLVLGGNYLVMFIGWEGVGLCSYLLIGFYYTKDFCADAGKKAFLTNRIGDMGFAAGLMLMLYWFGTLNMAQVNSMAVSGAVPGWVITAIAILLFVGATGKSAQIPLYVWLPDAMAGPTPVSALIHAATMVTSGVYLVARSNGLYTMSPEALMVVAGVGGVTALYAASIALVQNDIKKVLAYSTVSQLGYMFMGVGVGAYAAGVFHLYTHAFFKGLLFLGSGAVIHAMSGEQDMRKMGQLWKKLPHTAKTFLIATLAISGVPLFSGFFSKDEILWQAHVSSGGPGHFPAGYAQLVWILGVVAALLTAFYMFRLVYLTFFNSNRVNPEVEHHVHVGEVVLPGAVPPARCGARARRGAQRGGRMGRHGAVGPGGPRRHRPGHPVVLPRDRDALQARRDLQGAVQDAAQQVLGRRDLQLRHHQALRDDVPDRIRRGPLARRRNRQCRGLHERSSWHVAEVLPDGLHQELSPLPDPGSPRAAVLFLLMGELHG